MLRRSKRLRHLSPTSLEEEAEYLSSIPPDMVLVSCRPIRDILWQAYRNVAQIYDLSFRPCQQEVAGPWDELGEGLKDLAHVLQEGRSFGSDVRTVLNPLFLILLHEAIPVATSKRARIQSSAPEAPGINMVLKHWPALSELVIEIDEEETNTLLSLDKWILLGFLTYALNPNGTLRLNDKPPGPRSRPFKLSFGLCIRLFDIPVYTVTQLDLSGIGLTYLPAPWLSALPRLTTLDISHTRIRHLPIYFLRSHIVRLLWTPHTSRRTKPGDHEIKYPLPLPPRPPRCQSLVSYVLTALRRSSTSKSELLKMRLSERIRELIIQSYHCELCYEVCAVRSLDWLHKTRVYLPSSNQPEGCELGVQKGLICSPCLVFLTTPPSQAGFSDRIGPCGPVA